MKFTAALASLLLAAAPALADPAATRQCFRPDEVTDFRAVDRNTVIVRVGVNDRYRLDLVAPCPQVDWSEHIAIKATAMRVCSGLDAEIVAPSSIGLQRCPVKSITKLTPEEAAALTAKK